MIVQNINNNISVNLGNDTSFCPGQQMVLNAGAFASYLWQDYSALPTYTVTQTGLYRVTVKDADGCTTSDSIQVTVDCSDVFFPTSFTPNGDGLNDTFGPWGNLAGLRNYTFAIYNRFGQVVFKTNNPYQKWNGYYKGLPELTGTYVWYTTYSINTQPLKQQQGTLTLIK
ncbi:gliding motility-associated C-terminal domain-containing protein [Chitinophagaceae bacterium LWZ2-11]